ncbi:MAG: Gfo/Idh/MocA family oxidoreductase, partial [Chloroflexi bacterium]|nr:Gfo/Idh/MocA family oxidoreductase [Chloroflexota bacterium]
TGKYSIRIFPDFKPALVEKPDAVYVCTPTNLHIPTALRAAHAGCHLFIEKPLSHNLQQVDELVEVVERRGLTAVVGYQMRFHPALQRLHALVQEKKMGRILSVHAEIGEYLPGWHTYEDYRQMYASRKDLGGGVILSQIHEMDYLHWFFGPPQSVYALGGHLSRLEVDVEDTADILMEIRVDSRPVPVSLHEDYLQRPPSRGCTVIGDAGKIILDFPAASLTVFDGEGQQVEQVVFQDFQRNQMFLDETHYFLEALQGKSTPLVSLQDGVQSLRMALAARESLETGKVISLA